VRKTRYVALLRGINVGGRNSVPMKALREAFEDAGYGAVSTYVQSGNVLFESSSPRATLENDLETMLERRFRLPLVVVVRSHRQFRAVVEDAPRGFGKKPGTYHSDVVFLKVSLPSRRALRAVELRDGVDRVWPGPGVLYLARLSARLTQSRINRLASTPEYQRMTLRSWTTTSKLLGLLDAPRT
jgi:uncharacterized protein (DUF1697 family)